MSETPPAKNSFVASFNSLTIAVLIAVFILGVGIGTAFSSVPTANQGSISTRYDIDQKAPSPDVCLQFGASAIAIDVRAFVTFSPFNAYISQPKMQPGCVLRSSNWGVLQNKGLITSQEANECKNRLNTFGFTGSLEGTEADPKIACVYQNDAAGNLFLNQTGSTPENQRF